MKSLKYILVCCLAGMALSLGAAQRKNKAYEDYIRQYHKIAVGEMKRYHIPASITLAQGLLESGKPDEVNWPASRTTISVSSVDGVGMDGQALPTTMHRMNVSGLIVMPRIRIVIIPNSLRTGARYAFLFRLKITDYKDGHVV